jgi:23S rRNA (guanosine2251-2'-O)-methyltransferase
MSRFSRARKSPTVEGRRAVLESLRAGREVHSILLAEGIEPGPQIGEITSRARAAGVPVETAPRAEVDRRAATKHHQGVIAFVTDAAYIALDDLIEEAQSSGVPLIVLLDGIQDPQNLGAIARTVDAAGAHGIVVPERRAVGVTPGAVRASAGALEHVPVARVTNLGRAVDQVKESGIWVVGLDMAGDRTYTEVDLTRPTALVVGSEGEGISRLVREKCDVLAAIPLKGKVASLNASVAAAILLYEAVRQRSARPR